MRQQYVTQCSAQRAAHGESQLGMTFASHLCMSISRRHSNVSVFSISPAKWLLAATALIAVLGPAIANAAPAVQPLDAVRGAAEQLVRAQLPSTAKSSERATIVTAGYLDSRLRLALCDGKLTASRPMGKAIGVRNTVAVACSEGADWTVYVSVTVESEGPVLVTRHAIARGASLTAADVDVQTLRVPGLATHYVFDVAELADRHAKRALQPGTALSSDLLATNLLVKRGQQVTLLAAVGGIEVRASGKALGDGGATDRIRVQNLNSARVVEGLVESADIVRIAP